MATTVPSLLKTALTTITAADLCTLAAIGAALGVCFHLSIIRIEIDSYGWKLLAVYNAVLGAIFYTQLHVGAYDAIHAVIRTGDLGVSFNIGLATSIVLYRLFFHRLRRFPGPLGARISKFYSVALAGKKLQYHLEVEKLHAQYGDIVRTGPRELSIIRASAVPLIHGPQSACERAPFYSQVDDDVTKVSLNSSRDRENHNKRRRIWDRAFSMKSLSIYEPRVQNHISRFLDQLRASSGTPLNATAWTNFLSFDIMGDVGFSKGFHLLESGKENAAVRGLHEAMQAIGLLGAIPWLLRMLGAVPGLAGGYTKFMDWCYQQVEAKRKVYNVEEEPRDVISWLLKDDPPQKALDEDARLIVIAGSDTTAVTLAHALYFLAIHPTVYTHLQHLADSIFPGGDRDFSYTRATTIPYLDAIINETLRLKPALPSGVTRLTTPNGLRIDEVHIPADVIVSIPMHTISRSSAIYPRPTEFIPERWISGPEGREDLIKTKAAFHPFLSGVFSCVGKNLALMQLRSTLVRLALGFDVRLAEGEDGVAFDTGGKDTFTFTLPELRLVFTERKKGSV